MNAADLNYALHANLAAVEKRRTAELTAAYEAALKDAAAEASMSFTAITASGWQPPPEGAKLSKKTLAEIAKRGWTPAEFLERRANAVRRV